MSYSSSGLSRGLSIGVLTPSVSRSAGGLFSSVRFGFLEIRRQGCRVEIFAPCDANTEHDLPSWEPIRPKVYRNFGIPNFPISLKMNRDVARAGLDVIHQQGLWTFSSIIALRSRLPVVISPRGMLDAWALQNRGWKKRLALACFERKNLENAACIHALTDSEAQAVARLDLGTPIATIPNGIHLPQLAKISEHARPQCLSTEDKRKVLLFLGRIHPKKGLRELLTAWAILRDSDPALVREWVLVVAGWDDGGLLGTLKQDVERLQLSETVIFAGPLYGDAKCSILSHADAFVLPSYSEGLPMSVLEAWAYALPTFITPQCNLPAAFKVGASFQISTAPHSLAQQLARGLRSDHLKESGLIGRRLAQEQYSWDRIALMHIDLYRWICGLVEKPEFVT